MRILISVLSLVTICFTQVAFANDSVMHMTCRTTTSNGRPLASVYMHIDLTSQTTGIARIQVLRHGSELMKAKGIQVNVLRSEGFTQISDSQNLINLVAGHNIRMPVFVRDQSRQLLFSESSKSCYTGGIL